MIKKLTSGYAKLEKKCIIKKCFTPRHNIMCKPVFYTRSRSFFLMIFTPMDRFNRVMNDYNELIDNVIYKILINITI